MIENIEHRTSLRATARIAAKKNDERTVLLEDVESFESSGWEVVKIGKRTASLRRPKKGSARFEDRTWLLLFLLGFEFLSVGNKAKVRLAANEDSATCQLDAVAIDDEVAVIIEAKTQDKLAKRPALVDELAKLDSVKKHVINAVNAKFPVSPKRQYVFAMVTENVVLTEADRERAKNLSIVLMDSEEIAYYHQLVAQIGTAAKYQFLSDMLPSKKIAGLEIRVPSVRSKMGGYNCYTFPINPEYLAKIAYVSHRAKGRGSDIETYQRMITPSRIKKIRQYISDGGIFPTNIVINIEKQGFIQFDRGQQADGADGGVFGWLTIRPAYRTAWIIDGQHRIFAYAGHPMAKSSTISVVAFEGLPAAKQAELFIDINAKQKSVKRTLLEELSGDLRKDADSEVERARAVISRAVIALDRDTTSPLYDRIRKSDDSKDHLRCITMTAMVDVLDKVGMYYIKVQGNKILVPGALWQGEADSSMLRTITILNAWLEAVVSPNRKWWNLGSADGGGLGMNIGVTVIVNILRSVFDHFEDKGVKLATLDDNEVISIIQPFGDALASTLNSFSADERSRFRKFQGITGQTAATRWCQSGVHEKLPDFDPDGLSEYLELQKKETNKTAKELIDHLEVEMQAEVVSALKEKYGADEDGWWFQGVPAQVRKKVDERRNEDSASRGGREYYFDLIDYRSIVTNGELWDEFKDEFAFGGSQGRDKGTGWLVEINDIRKIVAHASSGKTVSLDQLARVEEIVDWRSSAKDQDDAE